MFTGIVTEMGKVISTEKEKNLTTFRIKANTSLEGKKIGGSIAINGACMTIKSIEDKEFTFDAIPETLELTNLSDLKEGSTPNLEPSLTLNQGIDGHLVQGHIDTTGTVHKFSKENDRTILTIKFPKEICRHLAFKGSITINGVSLTISDLQDSTFSVDLIPHTLELTNLGILTENDKVNLEIDLISRYLDRLLNEKNKETKYEYLKDRNLI